jgi:hypothetical protein
MLVRRAVTAGISTLVLVACSGTTSSTGGDGGTASEGGSIHIDLSDLSDACAGPTDCTASRIVDACGANCACVLKAFAKSQEHEAQSRFAVAATACQEGKYPASTCPSNTVESSFVCQAGHCRFADVTTGQLLANQTVTCD